MTPTALTLAGSDPSGGAGLQADLKTFHQHGVYGMAVVTLVTVQNTRRVSRVDVLSPELVAEQLAAVRDDLPPAAVKTGALGSAAVIEAVARGLSGLAAPLVVDPVMISKHGHPLLAADARRALVERLLPLATLLTPNAHEAAALTGLPVESVAQAEAAAQALAALGPRAVLVKGGHLSAPEAVDVLWADGRAVHLASPRVETPHTHGTGCTLSAAIAARLARGEALEGAVRGAKAWLTRALATAPGLGAGLGPVNHLAPVERS